MVEIDVHTGRDVGVGRGCDDWHETRIGSEERIRGRSCSGRRGIAGAGGDSGVGYRRIDLLPGRDIGGLDERGKIVIAAGGERRKADEGITRTRGKRI